MKTASETGYLFEDIRTFLIKRPWLHGLNCLVSDEEYRSIKDRAWEIPTDRATCIRAYMEGWIAAKG